MKKINIIVLLSIVFAISSCKTNTDTDTDAIFKSISKVYQLNADGSVDYQYQHELKYLTHYAFNRSYGETFVVYNPQHQVLNVNKSETTMRDGKKVKSPENAFNEVLPHSAAGAPEYNHLREMVITHVGLEVGASVNLDYNLKTEKGYYPFLADNIVLSEKSPVQKQEIIVKIHEGTALNYKLLNAKLEPKISTKDNFTVYKWTFKNLSASSQDYNMPHDGSYLPRLIFSTSNMDAALADIKNNLNLSLNDNIKETVKEKLKGIEKPIEKISVIKKIVAKDINLINVSFEQAGYKTHSLNHVWESNRATHLEKNLLFAELLKFSGLDANVLFAYPEWSFDKNMAYFNNFGHYFVKATIEGRDVILSIDPLQKNDLAFDIDNVVLLDINGEIENLNNDIEDIDNKISFITTLKMDNNGGVSGKMKAEISGTKNPYFDLLKDKDKAKQVISSVAKDKMIDNFELQAFDYSSCSVVADIKCKKIWKEQANYYFLNIPNSSLGIKVSHLYALGNDRSSPVNLNSRVNESYQFNIELPDSMQLVTPILQKLKNDLGMVLIDCKLDGNILLVKKKLKINKKYIEIKEYEDFKSLMDIWNKKTNNEIILKKE